MITGALTSGHWTGGQGIFNPDRDHLVTSYSPDPSENGSVITLFLVSDNFGGPCHIDSDSIHITVDEYTFLDAGPDIHVCVDNGTVGLSGIESGPYAVTHWAGGDGTFDPSRDSLVTNYIPAVTEGGHTITLYLIGESGDNVCRLDADSIAITVDLLPVVNAGPDVVIC